MSPLGIIVLVIISVLIGFFINSVIFYARSAVKAGKPAPAFYGEQLSGKKIGVSDWDQPPHPILLVFISPRCSACRKLVIFLTELNKKRKKAKIDLVIMGSNGTRDEFIEWGNELDEEIDIVIDSDGISKLNYAVYSLPAIFYISSFGIIRMVHTGFRKGDKSKFKQLYRRRINRLKEEKNKNIT